MAVFKLFPSQDASIYAFYPTMNTGIDAIIETFNINVNYNPVAQTSRFLIKFDNDEIEDVINNKISGSNFETYLKCFISDAQGIVQETDLEIYPVSGSWNNGSGTYLDSPPSEDGVSWFWRTYGSGEAWPTTGLSQYVTSSYSSSIGGGNWFTGSSDPINTNIQVTQSFNVRSDKDLKVKVTDIINVWYSSSNDIGGASGVISELDITAGGTSYSDGPFTLSGGSGTGGSVIVTNDGEGAVSFVSINDGGANYQVGDVLTIEGGGFDSTVQVTIVTTSPNTNTSIMNEGFIVKWEDVLEFNENNNVQPILQFYSVDTNTIYPPELEFRWDDYSRNTGSLSEIVTDNIYISLEGNKNEYYFDSIETFRLNVRPKYPIRTFQTSSNFTANYYLPENSHYAVKDLDTNEFIIDFDPIYTKISSDEDGNYFNIYMNGLQPERYYKILIKTVINNSTIIEDEGCYFKVING